MIRISTKIRGVGIADKIYDGIRAASSIRTLNIMEEHNFSSLSIVSSSSTELLTCHAAETGQALRYMCVTTLPSAQVPETLRGLTYREKGLLRSAYFWLQKVNLPTAKPSERIHCILEAIYSLKTLHAWDLLYELFSFRLSHSLEFPIHQYLGKIGFFKEQVELYQSLNGKIDVDLDIACTKGLGFANTELGNYPTAIQNFQTSLTLASDSGNQIEMMSTLFGLGYCHTHWGRYGLAIKYYKQHLSWFNRLSSDSQAEFKPELSKALAGLGYCMYFMRRFRKGIRYNKQALELSIELKDTETQWIVLGSLALIYAQLGQHSVASEYYQQRLSLQLSSVSEFQKIGAYIDMGLFYCYQRDFTKAISSFETALKEGEKRHFLLVQCQALRLLGFMHCWQGNTELALNYLNKGLLLTQQGQYPHHQSLICSLLSYIYSGENRLQEALQYARQAIYLADTIHFKNNLYEASGLIVLGVAKMHQGKLLGLRHIIFAFIKFPPWKSSDSKLLIALLYKRLLSFKRTHD